MCPITPFNRKDEILRYFNNIIMSEGDTPDSSLQVKCCSHVQGNDSQQIHDTFSLVYISSPLRQRCQKQEEKEGKERKGEENHGTVIGHCSPEDSCVRLCSSREESGHGSSEHQLSRFIWKTDRANQRKATLADIILICSVTLHRGEDRLLWLNSVL